MYTIPGHHHVSMMAKNAQITNQFYKRILGLRRVKTTVNQDDPSMYHLFYGDRTGSPGTELTFFEMINLGQTHRGTNAITRIGLIVKDEKSLAYWQKRFDEYGVQHGALTNYARRPALHFEDPDGLRLVLIAATNGKTNSGWEAWGDLQVVSNTASSRQKGSRWEAWSGSTVPEEHQIQGMGTIEITVRRLTKLATTLTEVFGYHEVFRREDEAVFQSKVGESSGEIFIKQLDGPRERPGRGSVHHLAIRAKDDAELAYWNEQVVNRGFDSTGIIDRFYFKSIYFRESNGILIEVATDGPGFTVDEEASTLGEKLALPPFLEERRTEIEKALTSIEEE